MPSGIEKIVFANPEDLNWDNFLSFGTSDPNNNWIIRANKTIKLRASYYPEVPQNERNMAMWVVGPKVAEGYTVEDRRDRIGDEGFVSIEPKFCGPQEFTVEAFLDRPTNRYPQQLTFRGFAPEKIVSTQWSTAKGGEDLRGSTIKYGDDIWLNVQTEGLNGTQLVVEVYDKTAVFGDSMVSSSNTICIEGEINLKFEDTFNWKSRWEVGTDSYYVKIKHRGGSYLKDDHDDEEHARYIDIENNVSSREVASSTTDRPAVVEQNQVNFERYELCKFEKITVKDQNENIVLFDQAKLNISANQAKKEFAVSDRIHFDFDKADITSQAAQILDGISRLLLDNPRVPVELGAHCDQRGSDAYNDDLSNRRAESSVQYLIDKGVDSNRISAKGYGKRRPLITSSDGELSEEEHQENRRVTIEFMIFEKDAQSILFDTIAGDESHPVDLTFTIDQYDTEPCIKRGIETAEHVTDVVIKVDTVNNDTDLDQGSRDGTAPFVSPVFADLSGADTMPFKYIWPANSSTNKFKYFIHSCRFYAFPDIPTVLVNVYPDIKWDFHIFLNLSNHLAVKWQNLPPHMDSAMRSEAGKIGAEKRWKQTDIEFGVVLQANWNKQGENSYNDEVKLTATFESKIKTLYEVFSALKEVSKYITGETKGTIVNTRVGSNSTFSVTMDPPNLCLGAEWYCSRGEEENNPSKEIGTEIKFYLKAEPLIKLNIVIDLLSMAINAAIAVGTGGTGNIAAQQILGNIRRWLSDDSHLVTVDMYIELVLSGEIKGVAEIKYHTKAPTDGDMTIEARVGITLRCGLKMKAALGGEVVEFYMLGEAEARGEGFITFGHQLRYVGRSNGGRLDYVPRLLFDGITVVMSVKAEIGMAIRKSWFNFESKKKLADYNSTDKIVEPFDILSKIAGNEVSVTLMD